MDKEIKVYMDYEKEPIYIFTGKSSNIEIGAKGIEELSNWVRSNKEILELKIDKETTFILYKSKIKYVIETEL